jgi:CRISPR-associated protein Csd2
MKQGREMMMESIKNRYDFVIVFDVENGNPNGDPDAGNMPRTDAETGHGIVTDVCLKRKIRNYVELTKDESEGFKIFIKEILNDKLKAAYKHFGYKKKTEKTIKTEEVKNAQKWMCENFYDVRAFGAVMSTGEYPCGVVRGPIQLNFAKSIDPVMPREITITRMAPTNEERAKTVETEFGKKNYIPYALYKAEGFISAKLSEKTDFTEDDLELFWEAVENMFEHDRSAARGKMIVRKLIVFKHESAFGNSPSHKLFERVNIVSKEKELPARQYSDYEISVDRSNLPEGISIDEKL